MADEVLDVVEVAGLLGLPEDATKEAVVEGIASLVEAAKSEWWYEETSALTARVYVDREKAKFADVQAPPTRFARQLESLSGSDSQRAKLVSGILDNMMPGSVTAMVGVAVVEAVPAAKLEAGAEVTNFAAFTGKALADVLGALPAFVTNRIRVALTRLCGFEEMVQKNSRR